MPIYEVTPLRDKVPQNVVRRRAWLQAVLENDGVESARALLEKLNRQGEVGYPYMVVAVAADDDPGIERFAILKHSTPDEL